MNVTLGDSCTIKRQQQYGLCSVISWERLTDALRKSNEISSNEHVIGIEVTDFGLKFVLGKRN